MIFPTPIVKHLGWIEKDRNIDDDDAMMVMAFYTFQ